jgi:hypothetical protein
MQERGKLSLSGGKHFGRRGFAPLHEEVELADSCVVVSTHARDSTADLRVRKG